MSMNYQQLLDDLSDHARDIVTGNGPFDHSLSEWEFVSLLPDLLIAGETRDTADIATRASILVDTATRASLLRRYYGLSRAPAESVIQIAKDDRLHPRWVRQLLDVALETLCRGIEDCAWVLDSVSSRPGSADSAPDHIELKAAVREVLVLLWLMPRQSYPSGLENALSRLAALAVEVADE